MSDTSQTDGLSQPAAEEPTAGKTQRMSREDHMLWMRDISTQIRDHYRQKTGDNKIPKPISHALFNRDMSTWFSLRQKEQAEFTDLTAIDPEPTDVNQ
jgi:hypothetical protein